MWILFCVLFCISLFSSFNLCFHHSSFFSSAESNQRSSTQVKSKSALPRVRKESKQWPLNAHQFVQNKMNRRLTFRQKGGKRYRGITLSPPQFWEMDKILHEVTENNSKSYFTKHLGNGINFTQPKRNVFTLWKQSKSNPRIETAFFKFDEDSWLHYIKTVHNEMKSLLHSGQ